MTGHGCPGPGCGGFCGAPAHGERGSTSGQGCPGLSWGRSTGPTATVRAARLEVNPDTGRAEVGIVVTGEVIEENGRLLGPSRRADRHK